MIDIFEKYIFVFKEMYGDDDQVLENQLQRYRRLLTSFQDISDSNDCHFFSTPGRIEIGGNHTDHNHGRVLASSIEIDTIAVAAKNPINTVILLSG